MILSPAPVEGIPAMDDMMTLAAAAQALGNAPETVRRWALRGKIRGSVLCESEGRLVPRSEVARILEEREAADRQGPSAWVAMTEREGHHS